MTTTTIDLDARYSVASMPGIAFYLLGYATEWTKEDWTLECEEDHDHEEDCYLYLAPEEYERDDMVRAVMVGDNREWVIDVDELTVISEDDYCAGCGQIGCGHVGDDGKIHAA